MGRAPPPSVQQRGGGGRGGARSLRTPPGALVRSYTGRQDALFLVFPLSQHDPDDDDDDDDAESGA